MLILIDLVVSRVLSPLTRILFCELFFSDRFNCIAWANGCLVSATLFRLMASLPRLDLDLILGNEMNLVGFSMSTNVRVDDIRSFIQSPWHVQNAATYP